MLQSIIVNVYLALHNDYPALVVYADPPGMLKDVCSKLPDKLTVLVVDLDLMSR